MSARLVTGRLDRLDVSTVHRQVVVRPAMCGAHSLFTGQVGDWTWDAVAQVCDADVLAARNPDGDPTYLAFYYYHVRGGPQAHVGGLTFGDHLDVVSKVYGCGAESVLTLHKISVNSPSAGQDFTSADFFDYPDPSCIYVQNFNRWVCRSAPGSNSGLKRSSPEGFMHAHLPSLPERHSPRRVYGLAKRAGRFRGPGQAPTKPVAQVEFRYELDASRDVNGVGLMYFASYHAIIDRGIWTLWRRLGRTDSSFVSRVVLDHKLCYLRNAELGSSLQLRVRLSSPPGDSGSEIYDVELFEAESREALAIASVVIATSEVS
ncbi:MAG: LnmK family bifunctional acyltransferase/decarboxylase [Myxococcota bacterium]